MTAILGNPNHDRAKSLLVTESVGPFRTTGLRPALVSMRGVLTEVRRDLPDLYAILTNNGMHVIRASRGQTSWSNHSWGIAIDFLVSGYSPGLGTKTSIRGLDALAPYFNKAGWYWGGGYRSVSRKDPMHFECGLALIKSFGL